MQIWMCVKVVTQWMVQWQLVLVLHVCKMAHAHIKIREAYHSKTFSLHGTVATVNSLKISSLKTGLNMTIMLQHPFSSN